MVFKSYKNTSVSEIEYAKSIIILLQLQNNGCLNSKKAAAQVLLSTYNGYDFKMDLTDLCYLDGTDYEAAITVIRGRVETLLEPHEVIRGGEDIFRNLWKNWKGTDIFRAHNQLE